MTFVAAPGYQPNYNPSVPFSSPIYGGLRPGMAIYIQGHVPHHADQFCINLTCGEYQGADIALHINPRYEGHDRVVFNTCQGGSWGNEEDKKQIPFKRGQHFEVLVQAKHDIYEVFVNGSRFYGYSHRIPLERVTAVHITGPLTLQTVNIIGGMTGPAMPIPAQPSMGYPAMPNYPVNLPSMGNAVVYNPTIPYVAHIPGGLSPKKTIIVRGNIPYGATGFHINFKAGYSNDIALHINPRFNEQAVVRNSLIGGCWGSEERGLSYNPFQPGQFFDLSIRSGNGRFKVFVNGQHAFDYVHRLHSLQQIDLMEIGGDVSISYIQL